MAGPTLRTYKAGSIIYFIEDKGSEIYVLQKGRVILISRSLDHTTEVKEDVNKGEFFGVKSALGMYPREETAQVLADTVVLVFTPQVFEMFCLKNPRIVLQMLKVFSGQLRKVHRKVREVLGESGEQDTSVELLRTAEYFYKQSETDHARYALQAVHKSYPASDLAQRADNLLNMLSSGQPYPININSIEDELDRMQEGGASGFNMQAAGAPPAPDMAPSLGDLGGSSMNSPVPGSPAAPDHPPDLNSLNLDNLGQAPQVNVAPQPAATGAGAGISELYYEGLNQFSQQNFDQAISCYQQVLGMKNFNNDQEAGFLEKALYEMGRAYQKKGDVDTTIEKLSEFVKKHPRSELIKKAMLMIADGYQKRQDNQRAAALYNKVANMHPRDKDSNMAKQRLEKLIG